MENCITIAMMHDLFEDINFNYEKCFKKYDSGCYILACLNLLTRNKEKYIYMKII